MLLRKLGIFLTLGVVLGGLSILYLSLNSPFNLAKIQEEAVDAGVREDDFEALSREINALIDRGIILDYLSDNAYIGLSLVLSSLSCIFVFGHLLIDKVFFKEFYEDPTLSFAVRRAILFDIAVTAMIYFKLSLANWIEVLSVGLFVILMELVILQIIKARRVNAAAYSNPTQTTRQNHPGASSQELDQ